MALAAQPLTAQRLADLCVAKGSITKATEANLYNLANIDEIQQLALAAIGTPIPAEEGDAKAMASLFKNTGTEVFSEIVKYKAGEATKKEKDEAARALELEKQKFEALNNRSVASIACERITSSCGSALKTLGKVALYAAPVVIAVGTAYYLAGPERLSQAGTFFGDLIKKYW